MDINKRKRMQGLLQRKRQETLKRLREVTKLKCKSFANLKFHSMIYHSSILVNIVRIQRWWRKSMQRAFFKDVLKKDNDQKKIKLKE